jgi:hypothetical protein
MTVVAFPRKSPKPTLEQCLRRPAIAAKLTRREKARMVRQLHELLLAAALANVARRRGQRTGRRAK